MNDFNLYIMPIAVAVEIFGLFSFGLYVFRRLALLQARINYLKRSLQLIDFYQLQIAKFLVQNHDFVLKEFPESLDSEFEKIDTGF